MAEIILIHPRTDFWAKVESPWIPLNLLHAATFIAKDYEVAIVDQRLDCDNWENKIRQHIGDETLFIGFTIYTSPSIGYALEIAKYLKDSFPHILLVFGGVHPSLNPENTLKHPLVDIIVRGEGEIPLLKLVQALKAKRALSQVKGIGYKEDDKLILSAEEDLLDLNSLPDIPYELVDLKKYLYTFTRKISLSFISSKGCPYRCSYCYNKQFNANKWRALDVEKTIAKVMKLKQLCPSMEEIIFLDDNFFVDLDRGAQIAEGFKKMNLFFACQGVDVVSLQKMDKQYLDMLERNGCNLLLIGIETGVGAIRKKINKPGSVADIYEVIKKLRGYKFRILCNLMYGFPGETEEDLKGQAKFMVNAVQLNEKLEYFPIYHYVPYPQTDLFEVAKQYGFKEPKNLEEWAHISDWYVAINDKVSARALLLQNIHFCSLFIDSKFISEITPFFIRVLLHLYRPIVRCRLKNFFFSFFIEKYIAKKLRQLFYFFRHKEANQMLEEC